MTSLKRVKTCGKTSRFDPAGVSALTENVGRSGGCALFLIFLELERSTADQKQTADLLKTI